MSRPADERERLREAVRRALDAALRAADPAAAVRAALRAAPASIEADGARLDVPGRLVVLGWGKAARPMLDAALEILAAASRRVDGGLVVVPAGTGGGPTPAGPVEIAEAAHPLPDARSPLLARRMLALASSLGAGDAALVLGSGGGSSLLACPVEPLSLEDLARVHAALLASGASIHETNAVRRHLSALHGGRLAVALGRAGSLALLVSDVPGDAPSNIGSGPTAPDLTTWHDVARLLAARVADVPRSVRELVTRGCTGEVPDTPKPGQVGPPRHACRIILRNADAVRAAAAALRARGFVVAERGTDDDLPALVAAALASVETRPFALVAGGEHPVAVTGPGLGGRNQHAAARAARELDAARPLPREVVAASLATDGVDGPTEAAGGLVDAGTWGRARAAGVEPGAALARCDAHALLRASGDLVVTGPTGTNVMDLALVVAGERA